MDDAPAPPAQNATFAERLQWLYDNCPDPLTGQRFTDGQLAKRINEMMPGFSVTTATLWNLRKGIHSNPSWNLVQGITKVFGRTPLFFQGDDTPNPSAEEAALAAAIRRAGVRTILLRASELPDASLLPIANIIDQVREVVLSTPRFRKPRDPAEPTTDDQPH